MAILRFSLLYCFSFADVFASLPSFRHSFILYFLFHIIDITLLLFSLFAFFMLVTAEFSFAIIAGRH